MTVVHNDAVYFVERTRRVGRLQTLKKKEREMIIVESMLYVADGTLPGTP